MSHRDWDNVKMFTRVELLQMIHTQDLLIDKLRAKCGDLQMRLDKIVTVAQEGLNAHTESN